MPPSDTFVEMAKKLKQQGLEKAATAWEKLTTEVPSIDPISIFKAVCSMKCAEMLIRFKQTESKRFPALVEVVGKFMEDTVEEAGGRGTGNKEEALRVRDIVGGLFPFDLEAFNSPDLFAIRMHAFDGLLLLAAQRFSKEQEVKAHIWNMQKGFIKVVIMDVMRKNATS